MIYHMKTTLTIDDGVMVRVKREAARRGMTMSHFVESALRRHLEAKPPVGPLAPLPTFRAEFLIDISSREALYGAMDDDALYKK